MNVKNRIINDNYTYKEGVNQDDLIKLFNMIKVDDFFGAIIEAIHAIVIVVNHKREVVFANQTAITTINNGKIDDIIGKKVGNVISCNHSNENVLGCGFSESCKECKALNLFFRVVGSNIELSDTANLIVNIGEFSVLKNLEFKIVPFNFNNEILYIISIVDHSDEIFMEDLTNIFFHDIVNKTGALSQFIKQSKSISYKEESEDKDFIEIVMDDITNLILSQKKLFNQQNGKHAITITELSMKKLFEYILNFFKHMDSLYENMIVFSDEFDDIIFWSDEILIKRVLINIIKNALEESRYGEKIVINVKRVDDNQFIIMVNNKKRIPEKMLKKLFSDIISTKGVDRGWGTKSMKIIGEIYLRGEIQIFSNETEGTTVQLTLPLCLEE